jgi:hypothetical protein
MQPFRAGGNNRLPLRQVESGIGPVFAGAVLHASDSSLRELRIGGKTRRLRHVSRRHA